MPTIREMMEKARKAKMQKGKPEPLSYDVLKRRIAQWPTVAVLTKEQARSFNIPGLRIARTFTTMPGSSLTSTLRQAVKSTQAERINLLVDGQLKMIDVPLSIRRRGLARPVRNIQRRRNLGLTDMRHRIGTVKMSADFGVELASDPDGTPVVVIITSSPEVPSFKIKHVVREGSKPKRKRRIHELDDKHTILKAPLTDDMLIEAIRQADADLLGEGHSAQVKWEENYSHHERPYNDHHLLVCLFLYIYFHKLYSAPKFYSDQRKKFFDFCTSRLPDDFAFNELRSFQKAINQLQVRSISFEEYCNRTEKPDNWYEKDKASLAMWYAIYQKAALSFEKALSPKMKE